MWESSSRQARVESSTVHNKVWSGCWGRGVQLPFGTPTFYISVPVPVQWAALGSWKSVVNGSCPWVPATHMGNPNGVAEFLAPSPGCCRHSGSWWKKFFWMPLWEDHVECQDWCPQQDETAMSSWGITTGWRHHTDNVSESMKPGSPRQEGSGFGLNDILDHTDVEKDYLSYQQSPL